MAWYKDLSSIDYFGPHASAHLRAVGWLDKDQAFPIGDTDRDTFERLRELLKDPWEPCIAVGGHECELCQFEGETGSSNLFVPGNGVIYVAPALITHYINSHKYLPPSEFVDAIMRCPDIRSMDYKKAILANGGRVLVKQAS